MLGQNARVTAADAWLDRLIPQRVRNAGAEDLRRARLLVAVALSVIMMGGPLTSLYYWAGSTTGAVIVILTLLATPVLLLVMRTTGSSRLASHVGIAILYLCLTALAFCMGGSHAPPLTWYASIPIMAVSLTGRRSAMVWTALVVASLAAFAAAEYAGLAFPDDLSRADHRLVQFAVLICLLVLALTLSSLLDGFKESALREAQRERAISEHIVNSLPGIFYAFDADGRFLRWNDNLRRVSGYSSAELAAMRPWDFFRGEDVSRIIKRAEEVFRTGESTEEAGFVSKDGRSTPYFLTGRRVTLDGLACFVGMGFDVTERKRAEAELHQARDQAQRYLNIAGVMMVALNARGEIALMNQKGYAVLEYEDGTLTGRNWFETCLPPQIRKQVQTVFGQLMAGKGAHVEYVEGPVLTRSGAERTIAWHNTVLTDESGAIVGTLSSGEDVTERKRVEEELQKLASVVQYSSELVNLATLDGRMVFLNEAGGRMLGIDPREAGRHQIVEVIPEAWLPVVHNEMLAALTAGGTWEGDLQYRNLATGALTDVHAMTFTIQDPETGAPQYLANVSLDITARKRAEGELVEARLAAEAANRAKSEFLANMSHEIRTPMTAILGFADLLLEQGDIEKAPAPRLEAARTIKRNGEFLLNIINDILDLSKIEAGKMTVERVPCSPCQLMAEVASLMRVRCDAKGLQLDIAYDGAVPETILTDPVRLRQILLNVVGNAVKFTERGSVRLIVGVARDAARCRLQIDVVDSGVGMSMQQAAQLFEPFNQADTSTTRKYGGTGLGLTISKRLAELLGGDVSIVETAPGVGTRVRITVDAGSLEGVRMLEDPRTETVVRSVDAVHAGSGDTRSGAGCHILLAEDGQDNQRLIAHFLTQWGAEVTVVENGRLAVDAALAARAAGTPFDVVLMDMQMPVLDGYDATRLLRQHQYAGRVIALTAHAMAGDREKCLAAGCDDFLTKPIERGKLIATLATQPTGSATPLPVV